MSGKTIFSGGQICQCVWGGYFLIFFWWQSGDSHAISRQSNCRQLSHFAICRQSKYRLSIYRLSTFLPPRLYHWQGGDMENPDVIGPSNLHVHHPHQYWKVWVWSGRLEDFESNTMSHNNDKDRLWAARAAKYLAFNLSIHFQINVLPLIQRSGWNVTIPKNG